MADAVVEALARETFLILPHPQVGKFWAAKAADVEGWLTAMARLAAATGADADAEEQAIASEDRAASVATRTGASGR